MSNLYEALENLIGTVPPGMEWLIYTMSCLIVFMVINSFVNIFSMIFKWVGGIR